MLQEAYQDVKLKGMPIRRAARQHGLPESTLCWRLANDISADVKRGGLPFSREHRKRCWQSTVFQWLTLDMDSADGKSLI